MPITNRLDSRRAVFYIDGGKCVLCGKVGKDRHHVFGRSPNLDSLEESPAAQVTLCRECHNTPLAEPVRSLNTDRGYFWLHLLATRQIDSPLKPDTRIFELVKEYNRGQANNNLESS